MSRRPAEAQGLFRVRWRDLVADLDDPQPRDQQAAENTDSQQGSLSGQRVAGQDRCRKAAECQQDDPDQEVWFLRAERPEDDQTEAAADDRFINELLIHRVGDFLFQRRSDRCGVIPVNVMHGDFWFGGDTDTQNSNRSGQKKQHDKSGAKQ